MSIVAALDRDWLRAHPLPSFDRATDKNSRGRLLCVGGGASAPGALLLTGEAALRAGCGKVQLATAITMVPHLAAAFPEAGMIALPASPECDIRSEAGEMLGRHVEHNDALVIGCGTRRCEEISGLTRRLLAAPRADLAILLDAGACVAAGAMTEAVRAHEGRVVLIPHPGEMAALMEVEMAAIERDPLEVVRAAVARFGAIVALRAGETILGAPDGRLLRYPGGGIGLATGGSGDVAAGVIGGLLARGADPLTATAWGVWLHGEAGRALGEPGFLARELLPLIPRLIHAAA